MFQALNPETLSDQGSGQSQLLRPSSISHLLRHDGFAPLSCERRQTSGAEGSGQKQESNGFQLCLSAIIVALLNASGSTINALHTHVRRSCTCVQNVCAEHRDQISDNVKLLF